MNIGLLNRLLSSRENLAVLAHKLELTEEYCEYCWQQYRGTVAVKHRILQALTPSTCSKQDELGKLLLQELTFLNRDVRAEEEVVKDIDAISHERRMEHITRVEEAFRYPIRKCRYVYELLMHLHRTLQLQIELYSLLKDMSNPEKVISKLQEQAKIEAEICTELDELSKLSKSIHQLVTGAYVMEKMSTREERTLNAFRNKLNPVFAEERSKGVFYDWAVQVINGIYDAVEREITEGNLDSHQNADMEFVNGPNFVAFVRSCAPKRTREITESQLKLFVETFRDWYTYRERKTKIIS